jgi:thiamine kinase-like enzyme
METLNGGSGAIIKTDGITLIKIDKSGRILHQAIKQLWFSKISISPFKIPKIISSDSNSISMEFITNSKTLDELLCTDSHLKNIRFFISEILIKESVESVIQNQIFLDKLHSIKYIPNDIIHKSEKILQKNKNITYLFGINHGDFTTKNILFDGKYYYLIDFLNSFIDSPLLDYSKFFQQFIINKEDIKSISNNIGIEKDLIKYRSFINISSLFNFLRMIPYIKTEPERVKINDIIREDKWIII